MSDEQDWSEVTVFADRLQAAGDPRGELLALELAAEQAPSSDDARQLNREAQRLRDAHRGLVWPSTLGPTQVGMRAGFVVSADYDDIAGSAIPLELVLSVRNLSLGRDRRLEDCVALLDESRTHGLRLNSFSLFSGESDPAINLGMLRELDTLEQLALGSRVTELEVLARFPKLVSCSFGAPLDPAELRSLAPLRLEHLGLRGQAIDPVLTSLLGDTLTSLDLDEWSGSLAPLAGLPRLRALSLAGEMSPGAAEPLDGVVGLEELTIPDVHSVGLKLLGRMQLRTLMLGSIDAPLASALPLLLPGLESLTIHAVEHGPFDVSRLAELPRLRKLAIRGDLVGDLPLQVGFERLVLGHTRGPVPIRGAVDELAVIDADLRSLPASLLATVRTLRLVWIDGTHDEALTELPRLMPQLERLDISIYRDAEWAWSDAAAVLAELPRLRWFEMAGVSVRERAELARAFPQLSVLTGDWPRSCGSIARQG